MQLLTQKITEYPLLTAAILAVILILLFLKKIIWWIFSFDKDLNKILHQKKSSEVRIGRITEQLSPLLENFPVDIKKPGTSTVFIGQPIDFLHFDPDSGVTFIEVKSGNSQLSPSQKKLKKLIEEGQVKWLDFRVK